MKKKKCFVCFQVSWMRKSDLHILTSSIITYTSDARFSVKHPEASDEWRLTIAFVQPRDAGVYECQVNTEPKMMLAFWLRVEGNYSIIIKRVSRDSSPQSFSSSPKSVKIRKILSLFLRRMANWKSFFFS